MRLLGLLVCVLVVGCEVAKDAAVHTVADAGAPDASRADGAGGDAVPAAQCTSAADCGPSSTCQGFVCTADGLCAASPAPTGTPCVASDPCAFDGRCSAGECVSQRRRPDCACPDAPCADGQVRRDVDGDGCPDCADCSADDDCPAAQRCIAPCLAEAAPRCVATPLACPPDAPTVCGCDGRSYTGACAATAAGVGVAHEGPCACGDDCDGAAFCEAAPQTCGEPSQCTPKPLFCPVGGTPVCGCDLVLYNNDCLRRAAAVGLASASACGCADLDCPSGSSGVATTGGACATQCVPCSTVACPAGAQATDLDHNGCADTCVPTPCGAGLVCETGAYCSRDGCGAEGTCRPRPPSCGDGQPAAVSQPVCTCEGVTFGSACEAAAAGGSVAYPGICATSCAVEGTDCSPGTSCEPNGCGSSTGVCVSDAACSTAAECGCDGTTYPSACSRRAAGVALAHGGDCGCPSLQCAVGQLPAAVVAGECPSACVDVACKASSDCPGAPGDAYCAYGVSTPSLVCAGPGVCRPRPQACPAAPAATGPAASNAPPAAAKAAVCGCDGQSYASQCAAAHAGVSVASEGSCPEPCGADGGCSSGSACDACGAGALCLGAQATCAGAAPGPSCGCDGRTWSSACERALAGVGALYEGACACATTADCGGDQLCVKDACAASTGVCVSRPVSCAPGGPPACDCAGNTYANTCDALLAGQSPAPCPTGCVGGDTTTCGPGAFCEACPGEPGQCQARPQSCGGEQGPAACGCDGVVYASDCLRRAAGVGSASPQSCCKALLCQPPLVARDTTGDHCPDSCVACAELACPQGGSPVDTNADGCADTCVKVCAVVITCDGALALDTDKDGCVDSCCKVPVCDAPAIDTDQDGCAETCPCVAAPCVGAQVQVDQTGDGCADSCACPIPPICAAPLKPADIDGDGCLDACACPSAPVCAAGQVAADTNGDGCLDACKCAPLGFCKAPLSAQDLDGDGCADACLCAPLACTAPRVPLDAVGADGCHDSCACPPLNCAPGRLARDLDKDGCPDLCVCGIKPECAAGSVPADKDADGCLDTCVCSPFVCAAGSHAVDSNGDTCPDTCAACGTGPACAAPMFLYDKDHDGCPDVCTSCAAITCAASESSFDTTGDGCPDLCAPTACLVGDDCGSPSLYCGRPNGSCVGGGKCQLRPSTCSTAWAAVCGCNGVSYPSSCIAAQKGVGAASLGICCPALQCGALASATDRDGDGCVESCVCPDGGLEGDGKCGACPVVAACPNGVPAADPSGDGCADTCECPADSAMSPAGCGGPTCPTPFICGQMSPKLWLVDRTGDGCYDAVEFCPEGTHGADGVGDGCPNTCVP